MCIYVGFRVIIHDEGCLKSSSLLWKIDTFKSVFFLQKRSRVQTDFNIYNYTTDFDVPVRKVVRFRDRGQTDTDTFSKNYTLCSVLFFPLGMHHNNAKAYIYGRNEIKRLAAVHNSNQFIAAAMTTSNTIPFFICISVLVLYIALSVAQKANCSCACV